MKEVTYSIAPGGVATSFTEAELPPEYARQFRNRFINQAGGAEKREGIIQYGSTVPGLPTLTEAHELVLVDGTRTLFVSGQGVIYKRDDGAGTYAQVHSVSSTARLKSVQMGSRLIFFNGENDNFFTEDGTTFKTLRGVIEQGSVTGAVSANGFTDDDIVDWVNGTNVTLNDIVYYPNSDAYGLVTAVSASAIHTTPVSAAARGAGAGTTPVVGDEYQVLDLVELNIIDNGTFKDNVATATTGTSAAVIAVSGVNFSTTDIRAGDWVSNTTRNAVTRVTVVSANINVSAISAQTSGDSLVFLKDAMPRAAFGHVHYGHLYMIDSRDQTKVRVTGLDDPQDVTSSGAGTFDFGTVQGDGEIMKAIGTYQRFLFFGGQENVVGYAGTTPFGTGSDFTPLALFPQGLISKYGVQTTGNDLLFISHDGLQAASQINDEAQIHRDGLSFAINETLREQLDDVAEEEIQLVHYRQRSWVLMKVGDKVYCYNYQTTLDRRNRGANESIFRGSFTEFDGLFARLNGYFERANGDLIGVGTNGKVYLFDQNTYDDDGETYSTSYQTGYLTGERSQKSVRRKQLKYIKPLFEAGAPITYTIRAEGGFGSDSTDTITVTASGSNSVIGVASIPFVIGGSPVNNEKYPLRVNGEVMRIAITTDDNQGPDIISRYTLYMSEHGAR